MIKLALRLGATLIKFIGDKMTKENKAVLFDIDGTLLDTAEEITDAMNKMLVRRGFETVDAEQMKTFLGGSARDIVSLSIGREIDEDLLMECVAEYTDYFMKSNSAKIKPFDGIKEAIAALSERGYKIGALSNKPEYEVELIRESILKPLGIEFSYGSREGVTPKPDPQGAYIMLEEMGADIEHSYFVGDGETDVLTAINSGMNGIAVLWGNRSREFLSEYGATVFAEAPLDLLDIIK